MKKYFKEIELIARDVYRKLGSGHNEVIYDRAMQVGLRHAGIKYESQKVVEFLYLNHYVGEGYADLIVNLGRDKKIAIELKAISAKLGIPEEQQLKNYMKRTGIKYGILINFQQPGKKDEKTELEVTEVKK